MCSTSGFEEKWKFWEKLNCWIFRCGECGGSAPFHTSSNMPQLRWSWNFFNFPQQVMRNHWNALCAIYPPVSDQKSFYPTARPSTCLLRNLIFHHNLSFRCGCGTPINLFMGLKGLTEMDNLMEVISIFDLTSIFFSISILGRPQRAGGKQPGEGAGDVHLQPAQAGQGAGKEEHFEKKWKF